MSIQNILVANNLPIHAGSIDTANNDPPQIGQVRAIEFVANQPIGISASGYPLSLNGELTAGEDRLIILRQTGTPIWGVGINDSNGDLWFGYKFSLGPAASAITLSNSTNQVVINGGVVFKNTTSGYVPSGLTYYEEYTNTIPFSGPWASPINSTIKITRIGRVCTLTILPIANTASTSASFITSSAAVPARFLPSVSAPVYGNSEVFDAVTMGGSLVISTGGDITVGRYTVSGANVTLTSFSNSSTVGFGGDINITWNV